MCELSGKIHLLLPVENYLASCSPLSPSGWRPSTIWTNGNECENGPHTSRKSSSFPFFAMSYILIPNPRPKKFWHSPAFILKRAHQHQPTEELASSLKEKHVRHGVPTAVDRWIAAGLNTGPPCTGSAHAMVVPMLAEILEDLVECQLSTRETEVSSLLCS